MEQRILLKRGDSRPRLSPRKSGTTRACFAQFFFGFL